MKALVTGGAGFIGSQVVRGLLARGDEVVVLDDFSSGRTARLDGLSGSLDVQRGDIRDEAAVARAVAGAEAIVHLAAQVSVPRSVAEPAFTAEVNVLGCVRLLEAAVRTGATRFVLASSCAVYGAAPAPQREDTALQPLSPYAASKLAGESFVTAFSRAGLPGVSLRFFNVYGRDQDAQGAVIPAFAAAIAGGRPPRLFGDGLQSRDFVHVEDVARAILLALEASPAAAGRAFNVGSGRAITMRDLASLVGTTLGREARPTHESERAGDVRSSCADIQLAREVLGFEARVELEDGLRRSLP